MRIAHRDRGDAVFAARDLKRKIDYAAVARDGNLAPLENRLAHIDGRGDGAAVNRLSTIVLAPQSVSTTSGFFRPPESSYCRRATQRIALPHISPRLPSALYISIRTSACADGQSRISPSPPIPKCRSDNRFASAPGSAGRRASAAT